ncbi:MAG: TerB family tellurite resistance protein [Alphaproteobacteria bacterium]
MSIWGKLFGGAAGLVMGGPLGALVGAVAGHAVDRFRDESGSGDATQSIGFTIGVIVLGAKMAKADGVVSEAEIAAFRRLFHVPPEEERNVARIFDQARRAADGYEPYARQLARLLRDRPAVLEELLNCLFHIAAADGRPGPAELAFLRNVAELFGVDDGAFARLSAAHTGTEEQDPYAVLGLARSASITEIRARYRHLARENHPDRLVAQGLPPEFVRTATVRMAAINAAYDAVVRQAATA